MAQAQKTSTAAIPNDLAGFWMPFTANRAFKARPRLIARAKDMHYYTPEGRAVLDAAAGLWCTNAGHNRDPIVQAIKAQAAELDFAPTFQFGHPRAFELANRIAALAPGDLDSVFFCNSGSEAADTALKIALAYWNARGEAQRVRFVGRERGYHGVGFGGMAVGGLANNRKAFGVMLPGVDHLAPVGLPKLHQIGVGEGGDALAQDALAFGEPVAVGSGGIALAIEIGGDTRQVVPAQGSGTEGVVAVHVFRPARVADDGANGTRAAVRAPGPIMRPDVAQVGEQRVLVIAFEGLLEQIQHGIDGGA